jgi:hypothetical protein
LAIVSVSFGSGRRRARESLQVGKSAPFNAPPANITGFGSTGNVYEELDVTTVSNE